MFPGTFLFASETKIRKLEKAVTVRNSLPEKFSGKFRRCWKIPHRFSGSTKCYPCQGLGTFRQGKRLLENWPRFRERCWISLLRPPQPSSEFKIWGELMVIRKGWFETGPCRATLNTPFSALCPRILGTRFTNYTVGECPEKRNTPRNFEIKRLFRNAFPNALSIRTPGEGAWRKEFGRGTWPMFPGTSLFTCRIQKGYPQELRHVPRRRTNVQQLTCKIDLPFSFYYLFFSFVLLEPKPFVLKGKVLGEKWWKSVKKCEKLWNDDFAL